jgi:hypothetical protein
MMTKLAVMRSLTLTPISAFECFHRHFRPEFDPLTIY